MSVKDQVQELATLIYGDAYSVHAQHEEIHAAQLWVAGQVYDWHVRQFDLALELRRREVVDKIGSWFGWTEEVGPLVDEVFGIIRERDGMAT